MTQKIALGKGLSALIPEGETGMEGESIQPILLAKIQPNPDQPRQAFDPERLAELANSLKDQGVLQPIIVRPVGENYQVVAGERRVRAAQLAGFESIPALVRENVSKEMALELALIENLQREDLNPIEEARAYKQLATEFGLSQEAIAGKVGKERSSVANALRLLNLPQGIQTKIAEGELSPGQARLLLRLSDPQRQNQLAERIVQGSISVRELERLIESPRPIRRRLKLKRPAALFDTIEQALKRFFGTNVILRRGKKRGKIVIEFYSDDDLNRILQLLKIAV